MYICKKKVCNYYLYIFNIGFYYYYFIIVGIVENMSLNTTLENEKEINEKEEINQIQNELSSINLDDNNYKNKLTPEEISYFNRTKLTPEEIKIMGEKNGEDLEEYLNEVIFPKLLNMGIKNNGFNGKVIKIVC